MGKELKFGIFDQRGAIYIPNSCCLISDEEILEGSDYEKLENGNFLVTSGSYVTDQCVQTSPISPNNPYLQTHGRWFSYTELQSEIQALLNKPGNEALAVSRESEAFIFYSKLLNRLLSHQYVYIRCD